MSSRRRAAGMGRKPKVIYPTSTQPNPDPCDSVPTMSVADSGMLKRTLAQSRQSWTHGAFTRFYPEPPRAGGKKYSTEVTPAGTCTVCIGPHMFLDTKFFTVYNPPPPPPPRSSSPSSDPTMSGQQELLEEEHIHTPSLFMGASPGPIPERVIELIMARTAGTPLPPELEEENATEERKAAAAAAAASSLSTLTTTETTAAITEAISEAIAREENKHTATDTAAMDVDKDETNMDIDVPSASGEIKHTIPSEQILGVQPITVAQDDTVMAEPDTVSGATLKTESEGKALSLSGTSTSLPVSTPLGGPKQKSASKSSPPRYQVIFEFQENPGVRWLFPSETSLELTPAEDNEPAKISSSFYLTTKDDHNPSSDGTSPSTSPTTSSQAITMVILQVTNELWEGLDRSILDPSLVYRSMMDKMRHIPVRSYIKYTLPVTFTNEDLAPMGLWKLPDNKVVTIKSLQPPKRRSEPIGGHQSKPKRAKAVQETPAIKPSKKITAPTPTPKQIGNKASEDVRACHYCGTRDTPMWRRGPDGTKTLCNSCGISWKRGKIEVTSVNGAAISTPPPSTPSRTRAPVPQAPLTSTPRAPTPPPPPPPAQPAVVKTPAPPPKASTARAPTPVQTPVAPTPIITTADAAIAILKESLAGEPLMANGRPKYVDASLGMRPAYRSGAHSRRTSMALRRHDPYLSSSSTHSDEDSDDIMPEVELVPLPSKKQRFSKGSPISSGGPKLVPINQISVTNSKLTTKPVTRTVGTEKEKDKEKDTPPTTTSTPSTTPTTPIVASTAIMAVSSNTTTTDTDSRTADTATAAKHTIMTSSSTSTTATTLVNSIPAPESMPSTSAGSSTTTEHASIPRSSSASSPVALISAPTKPARSSAKSTGTKEKAPKSTAAPKTTKKATVSAVGTGSTNMSPISSEAGAMIPPLTTHTKHSPPTAAVAKMTLLKSSSTATMSHASTVKHVSSSAAGASPIHTAEDGLSLYPAKNLYTNNTATFPLHFPTISIAFGPNNAYYTYPNCAVVLFENHFQIKLMQGGTAERTEIDIWKEAIESTEFHVVDVGDGESMIVLKALLRQFLTRFNKELLNPDKEESLIVFRFRERLDGGGPPVKPLLEQWLTTEIPVATPVETPVGTPKGTLTVGIPSTSSSVHSSASTTPTTRTGASAAR